MSKLTDLLAIPELKGLDMDAPETTMLRRKIVRDKKFLYQIYSDWYRQLARSFPRAEKPILELGAGPGFLSSFIPGLITSDILPIAGIDLAADAMQLPLTDESLAGIVMVNVMHHFSSPGRFLAEAERVLKPGGRLALIEPWSSQFSNYVYTQWHHEDFDPDQRDWNASGNRPLSDANGALPWIIFARDRSRFENDYPALQIVHCRPIMPFRYLVSGGFTLRSLLPGAAYPVFSLLESLLTPWYPKLAMFAEIVVQKKAGRLLRSQIPPERTN